MTIAETTAKRARVTSRFDRESTALEVIRGVDLSGCDVIVTGGSSGLGTETARALAASGAMVTITARDPQAGAIAAAGINRQVGAERVRVEQLELGNLVSVRAFADRWGRRPLRFLINNAGVMACPLAYTDDGFELQLGTNHLGHFLLTVLLTPALELGGPSRVVSLSSAGHFYGDFDFDDPHYHRRVYHPFAAYGQSKTANALFAVEYDRRCKDCGIRAFSVMPGMIVTKLGRHMTPELRAELGLSSDTAKPGSVRYKSAEQGAATSVWAAIAPELDGMGGLYLEDCAEAVPYTPGLPRGQGVKPHALNPETAARLWDFSEKSVGTFFEPERARG
jgi:NAD(P)-dependent dehydrogenase (short-subunit alcohol dehydrogenase family)